MEGEIFFLSVSMELITNVIFERLDFNLILICLLSYCHFVSFGSFPVSNLELIHHNEIYKNFSVPAPDNSKLTNLSLFEIPKILNAGLIEHVSPFYVNFFSKLCPSFMADFWEVIDCFGSHVSKDPRLCNATLEKVLYQKCDY
jgi:hypothetical protein